MVTPPPGPEECILDTNLFVAAGFHPRSDAAWVLARVERGELRLIWNEETRRETERIIRKIPRLSWERFASLFREENRSWADLDPERFLAVPDPDDRKFAALAAATGATLVTLDEHLLQARRSLDLEILTPSQYRRRIEVAGRAEGRSDAAAGPRGAIDGEAEGPLPEVEDGGLAGGEQAR